MLVTIIRLFYRFWVGTGLYYKWSNFWRFVLERKYRDYPIKQHADILDLRATLAEAIWVTDPLGGAFDTISYPGKVQASIDSGIYKIGDCDDFAVYAGHCLRDMYARGVSVFRDPKLMTVAWFDSQGKWNAHVVCVFFDEAYNKYGHIGNWFRGAPQLGFNSYESVVKAIIGKGSTLVAWSLGDIDLHKVERLEA